MTLLYSQGGVNRHLLTPDRELITSQIKDATKIQFKTQLGEPMCVIGISYRSIGEGYRSRNDLKSATSPKSQPSVGDCS